jgi:hypothetical protein
MTFLGIVIPDISLCLSTIFSEKLYPLFRIMLKRLGVPPDAARGSALPDDA